MESQGPNTNGKSPSMSNSPPKMTKEKISPSPDPHGSSEKMNHDESNLTPNSSNSIVATPPILQASGSQEDPDQEREYGCKYCNKKFTNKQALGGHQNAHKLERALEKNPREIHGSHFGYFRDPSSYPGVMVAPPPFPDSLPRSYDFMNRNMVNRPYILQEPMHFPRPTGVPMTTDPYGPRPIPGLNRAYPGWNMAPPPRFPYFMPNTTYVPNRNMASQFMYMGSPGSSNARPISESLSNFTGSRSFVHGRIVGGRNNNGPESQQDENSGLDLSLKL